MPLVFTENEATGSGIKYADRTGISYQYPRMYRRLIQSGERFVYYRGRRRLDGGRSPQVYFGVGVVGDIMEDAANGERLVCRILDFRPFPVPLPFKDANGKYLEVGGKRRGYFQLGVRTISPTEFRCILEASESTIGSDEPLARPPALSRPDAGPGYASPEKLRAIEAFAIRVALEEIERRYPGSRASVLPRNNPGFDIEVGVLGESLYVEVKGTERSAAQFFATEGELQFSRRNASRYRLIVVHRINLTSGQYNLLWSEGPISADAGFRLRPVQWACEMIRGDSAKL